MCCRVDVIHYNDITLHTTYCNTIYTKVNEEETSYNNIFINSIYIRFTYTKEKYVLVFSNIVYKKKDTAKNYTEFPYGCNHKKFIFP